MPPERTPYEVLVEKVPIAVCRDELKDERKLRTMTDIGELDPTSPVPMLNEHCARSGGALEDTLAQLDPSDVVDGNFRRGPPQPSDDDAKVRKDVLRTKDRED
jgi:hypothetical protein